MGLDSPDLQTLVSAPNLSRCMPNLKLVCSTTDVRQVKFLIGSPGFGAYSAAKVEPCGPEMVLQSTESRCMMQVNLGWLSESVIKDLLRENWGSLWEGGQSNCGGL